MSGCSDGWVSLSDLKFDGGSGDYSEVSMLDFQDEDLMEKMEQESGPASRDIAASPSCCTASSNWTETLRPSLVRKLSLSTLSSRCAGDTGYEGTCSNQPSPNKIQRRPLRPVINSSSPSVCEWQNIFDAAEANPFVPFASVLPSSLEPLFVDMSSLTSFDIWSPTLAEDLSRRNPVLGVRLSSLGSMDVHQLPLQDCVHPEIDWAPLGEVIKPEAPMAASIRLARKKRIHKNRKATSSSTSSVGRPAPSLELPVQITGEQRQGAKDRTGAKYLLEKQLRASDVGSLSRIILPKKDAEIHLPSLARGVGIPFSCEDFITGEIMELRFRFWLNNKSRMYVLENTGEFIRRHQLREADSIAMYRDEEDGTYLLRPGKAGDGQEPRPRAVARFGRKGKEIPHMSSSGSLARSTSSSLDGSVSETCVSSNIDFSGK